MKIDTLIKLCYYTPMRKFISTILLIIILASPVTMSYALGGSGVSIGYGSDASGATSVRHESGRFADVSVNDWFYEHVGRAYNLGFLRGRTATIFEPHGFLTLGEAVTIAARLRSVYHTGGTDFDTSVPFYAVYSEYALTHGIIDRHLDYSTLATRAQFADMIFRALPNQAFEEINSIADFGITDVMPGAGFGNSVYALYRAGVLSGSDRFGTFLPNTNITRAESSAITVRAADPNLRVNFELPTKIPAEIIYQRSTNAVFMIETFDEDGISIRTASGFFITSDGLALTNLHIFNFVERATVTLRDGREYAVLGLYAYCHYANLAAFSIDSYSNDFYFLHLADSDLVETGNTIYVLGSPMALMNSITDGVVSTASRIVDESPYIQFSAPISFGSGGSPLLNSLGQVIGVAYLSFSGGQNINLAVPINRLANLEFGEIIPLNERD